MSAFTVDDLDKVARSVRIAQTAAAFAGALIPGDLEEAKRQAKTAREACTDAVTRLGAMGAKIPGVEDAPTPAAWVVPLNLLDTPATRRLLAVLEEAAAAGAEVDRERGWLDADGDPTGYGETYEGRALALRSEVFGPADKRQG